MTVFQTHGEPSPVKPLLPKPYILSVQTYYTMKIEILKPAIHFTAPKHEILAAES